MILIAVAREIPFTAQIPGIAQIMCSERVLCFLNYLKKSDRSGTGLISGLRAIPPEGGRPRQARCFAFALSSFRREAAHEHASCLACAHFAKTQVLMLGPKVFGLELWEATRSRVSWCTTARLQRQEYRLRRRRPPPIRRAGRCPPFKSATPGLPGPLRFRLFAPCPNGNAGFRCGKKNRALGCSLFSPKRNPKDFSGEKGENEVRWPNPAGRRAGRLHQWKMFYVEHSIDLIKHT